MIRFNFIESFKCPYCLERWMFRADFLTLRVAQVKLLCNAEIQAHYALCCADKAIKQAESFDERFCNFLKKLGINANVIKEDNHGQSQGS